MHALCDFLPRTSSRTSPALARRRALTPTTHPPARRRVDQLENALSTGAISAESRFFALLSAAHHDEAVAVPLFSWTTFPRDQPISAESPLYFLHHDGAVFHYFLMISFFVRKCSASSLSRFCCREISFWPLASAILASQSHFFKLHPGRTGFKPFLRLVTAFRTHHGHAFLTLHLRMTKSF